MIHWIQGNSTIHLITRITRFTLFPFVSDFDQFFLYFPKLIVDGIPAQRQLSCPQISNIFQL